MISLDHLSEEAEDREDTRLPDDLDRMWCTPSEEFDGAVYTIVFSFFIFILTYSLTSLARAVGLVRLGNVYVNSLFKFQLFPNHQHLYQIEQNQIAPYEWQ